MISMVVATANRGKFHEISHILGNLDLLRLLSSSDLGTTDEVVEAGETFLENARAKALAFCRRYPQENILAEDSGLEVAALGNRPGIFSARYAGENATDLENIQKLLAEMQGKKDRRACFVSVIVSIFAGGEEFSFRGEVTGTILPKIRGNGGFGYDPVFYYPPLQKSFAELTADEKNRVSHRGQALTALKHFLIERFGKRVGEMP